MACNHGNGNRVAGWRDPETGRTVYYCSMCNRALPNWRPPEAKPKRTQRSLPFRSPAGEARERGGSRGSAPADREDPIF